MIKFKIFLIFLSILLPLNISSAQFFEMDNKEIKKKILKIHKRSQNFIKRLQVISYYFLKTPYINNPLGEGKKLPIYSFKSVDCLTFVETVLAISIEKDFDKMVTTLQHLRYKDGIVKYEKRNHLMGAQWIPNNIKNGFIKEITESLVPKKVIKRVEKKISFKSYKFKKFKFLEKELKKSSYKLNFIPIKYFLNNYYKIEIPDGSIMTIVRDNKEDYPIMISHLGFIIKSKFGYIFRNGSFSSKYREVRDIKLISYLRFYYHFYRKGDWPIVGVQFFYPLNKK